MTTSLQNRLRRVFSTDILPLIGYSLLLVAVINIGMSLAPLQLTNPLWKFQTGGEIIEKTPFILLGMVLIYYGGDRSSVENAIFKTLSWLSLASAILLLSIIPLNISNSWQIYEGQNIIHSDRLVSQQDTIQQFKQQLIAARSETEIGAVLQQQVAAIDLSDLLNIQQLKNNILSDLSGDRDAIRSQAFPKNEHNTWFDKCLGWNLGALVAATLFFKFWQATTRDKIK